MATRYAEAVAALHRVPLDQFVEERKRLAGELKAAGDKDAATRLTKLPRPPISAWAVNQLWWRERDAFQELLASAQRLRQGDHAANTEHRRALNALRTRAAELLSEGGHGATDATLRKVTTTLSALAAAGGFEPDAPGALSGDREPPGFEALEGLALTPPPATRSPPATPRDDSASERAAQREHEKKERRRREQERQQRLAERRRLEAEVRSARRALEDREREAKELRAAQVRAEQAAAEARQALHGLESRLAELEVED